MLQVIIAKFDGSSLVADYWLSGFYLRCHLQFGTGNIVTNNSIRPASFTMRPLFIALASSQWNIPYLGFSLGGKVPLFGAFCSSRIPFATCDENFVVDTLIQYAVWP
jgi:hypothetical protein